MSFEMNFLNVLMFNCLFLLSITAYADIASLFSKAKLDLYNNVYQGRGETFYTGCLWETKSVNLESCNLQYSFPKGQLKRAKRTEVEHVIPASWLYKKNGKWRNCYIEAKQLDRKIREYCQQTDFEYRKAHNDLVNLRPVIGQINALRSNKAFSDKPSGQYIGTFVGKKKMLVYSRLVIPDNSIKGDIARIAFYMMQKYGASYSNRQEILFFKWNDEDPVSDEEIFLNQQIMAVQGEANFYLEKHRDGE